MLLCKISYGVRSCVCNEPQLRHYRRLESGFNNGSPSGQSATSPSRSHVCTCKVLQSVRTRLFTLPTQEPGNEANHIVHIQWDSHFLGAIPIHGVLLYSIISTEGFYCRYWSFSAYTYWSW